MKDATFGNLEWADYDAWETSIAIPYFRGFGESVPGSRADISGGADKKFNALTPRKLWARAEAEKRMFRADPAERPILERILASIKELTPLGQAHSSDGEITRAQAQQNVRYLEKLRTAKITLSIQPGDNGFVPRKPTPQQHQAWNLVTSRGSALWDEVVQHLFDHYRRQHPIRARWWKAIYGDHALCQNLPEVHNLAAFKKLIFPDHIRLQPANPDTDAVDIAIHFRATWHIDGISLFVRDGKVFKAANSMDAYQEPKFPDVCNDFPVFGMLERTRYDAPWTGYVTFNSFLDCRDILDDREWFHTHRSEYDIPWSRLWWHEASGLFRLAVHARREKPPAKKQADELAAFLTDEKRIAPLIKKALFDHYLETFHAVWKPWLKKHRADIEPPITSPDELREAIELRTLIVQQEKKGAVHIALEFATAWDYHGVIFHIRNGKIIQTSKAIDLGF